MVTYYLASMAGFILLQRMTELYIAERNRKWALRQGASEFGARHYPLFFLLHTGWLAGWLIEAGIRGDPPDAWYLWLIVFVCAQGLRYWCILSLGRAWNTRILVIPGGERVRMGPYRLLPHPNYLAVAIELLSVPLVFGAVWTALAATLLNAGLLIMIRIPEEERALQSLRYKTLQ
jgi:methyltransferase